MTAILILLLCTVVSGEVSLSFSDLGGALRVENDVISALDKSLKGKSASQDVNNIRRYIGNFRDLANNLTHDFEDPLQAYLVVKHLTDDFENLKSSITDRQLKDVVKQVSKLRSNGRYPTSKDLDMSAQSVIRLQQIYDLKINEMSKNSKHNRALGMFDFFRLAGQSLLSMDVSLAVDWFETALKTVNKDSNLLPKETLESVKQQVQSIKTMVGTNFESLREQIKSVPDFMIDALALQFPGIPVAIIKKFKSTIENVGEQKIDKTYKKLCRDQKLTNDVLDEDKICVLATRVPQDAIAPYKVEILSTEPAVFLVHELVSNLKSQYLKDYAISQYEESHELPESYIKGAVVVNLQEISDEILAKLSKEINKLSGMNIKQKAHHTVKILNFGIGGYEDYLPLKQEKTRRSPKTTVEIFLNDVHNSGRTVLPGLRMGLPTIPGSALFVYHAHGNKRADSNSFHASCPIRSGSKWILRKEFY